MRVKNNTKYKFAKKLRAEQTEAEKLLWFHLRNRQLAGIKFRRQQVIGIYIVDFVSFEEKIIIELDGGQHNSDEGKQKDEERTHWLETQGYRVIRFWNNEVLTHINDVLAVIYTKITPDSDTLPN